MLDAMQCTVHYELLRSQVLGMVGDVAGATTGDQAWGIGLALLLSEGMPGWLKAVEGALRASVVQRLFDSPGPVSREGSTESSAAPVWLSSMQRHELTTVLASLVLSTRPLARHPSREGYRS